MWSHKYEILWWTKTIVEWSSPWNYLWKMTYKYDWDPPIKFLSNSYFRAISVSPSVILKQGLPSEAIWNHYIQTPFEVIVQNDVWFGTLRPLWKLNDRWVSIVYIQQIIETCASISPTCPFGWVNQTTRCTHREKIKVLRVRTSSRICHIWSPFRTFITNHVL